MISPIVHNPDDRGQDVKPSVLAGGKGIVLRINLEALNEVRPTQANPSDSDSYHWMNS